MAFQASNLICEACGSPYRRPPNRALRSKYCSNHCKHSAKQIPQEDLARLYYDEQYSTTQLAAHYGCSVNKIRYWMERHGFELRNQSDATYLSYNPGGDPFQTRAPRCNEEWKLFGAGLALYMGEGAKTGGAISISNADPRLHRIFIAFLETFCAVQRSALRGSLNLFDDTKPEEAIVWWAGELGLERSQFCSPHVRSAKRGSYKRKCAHGTLSLTFHNVKLKRIILAWCDEYYQQYDS